MIEKINENKLEKKNIEYSDTKKDLNSIFLYKASGKRKNAHANITVSYGQGGIIVNGKNYHEYFQQNSNFIEKIDKPLQLITESKDYDFVVNVKGGGINGQSDAIVLAISKILVKIDKTKQDILKKAKLLKQDVRIKERRKYGLKKARKASQYSKR